MTTHERTCRVLVLDDYQDVARSMTDWTALDARCRVDVLNHPLRGAEDVVAAVRDHDVVIAMRERTPFPESVLARLPGLRLLVTTGMRNASIDLAAAARLGITVCGTQSFAHPPVELTWALLLGLARGLHVEPSAFRAGTPPWQRTVGADLRDHRLGLLGLGRIGGAVAAVGRAFGMDVVAWSANLTPERTDEVGVRLAASKEELLRESDFVSVHLVASERTRGLVSRDDLWTMKPSAFLVNTSRAAIVDEDGLVEALRAGRIAGAGLDVFGTEPLPADSPLRGLPNVLATPHLGYVTRDNYARFYRQAVEDVDAFLAGTPVRVLTP